MPPKVQVTPQMILDAAFDIVRREGHESLNARRIADRLGCSTQPILYNFKTVDEIRMAVYRMADEYHSEYIMPDGQSDQDPMLALGLNYIRFGHEERHLFRFLFQTDQFGSMDIETLVSNPQLSAVIGIMAEGMGCGEGEAREMFVLFFVAVHGYASLLANNSMEYDEQLCAKMLETIFGTFFPF